MIKVSLNRSAKPDLFTISLNDEPWRDIHRKIFGRKPEMGIPYHSKQQFFDAFHEIEYKNAFRYVLKRLSLKNELSIGLKKKLEELLVSPTTINRVIKECQHLGFLNDEEWVESFIRGKQSKNFGPQTLIFQLMRKGISREQAVEKVFANNTQESQQAQMRSLLEKKFKNQDLKQFSTRQKAIACLVRKGFPLEDVYNHMNTL